MPWKETTPMEQRLAFVVEWLKHECSMAELCRSFGISRQTGYELLAHYTGHGLDGLKPRSRAPHHHPNAIAEDVCAAVIRAKARHSSWDPRNSGRSRTSRNQSRRSGQWPARVELFSRAMG